jgi:hypothetical protein
MAEITGLYSAVKLGVEVSQDFNLGPGRCGPP